VDRGADRDGLCPTKAIAPRVRRRVAAVCDAAPCRRYGPVSLQSRRCPPRTRRSTLAPGARGRRQLSFVRASTLRNAARSSDFTDELAASHAGGRRSWDGRPRPEPRCVERGTRLIAPRHSTDTSITRIALILAFSVFDHEILQDQNSQASCRSLDTITRPVRCLLQNHYPKVPPSLSNRRIWLVLVRCRFEAVANG
jgi:hypothetical protein